MTESTSKSKLRIENKKKKMAALLDIAKLNEYDRVLKSKLADKVDNLITVKPETEPSPKRIKIVDIPRYLYFCLTNLCLILSITVI